MSIGTHTLKTLTVTSSASAGTLVLGAEVDGLGQFDWFEIDATLGGAGGGPIDVAILRKVTTNDWREWLRFNQVSANATSYQSAMPLANGTVTATAKHTDAAGSAMVMAAGGNMGGHPGENVRLLCLSGTGASAGCLQTVTMKCWTRPR